MQDHVLSSERSEHVLGPVLMTLHRFAYEYGKWYVDADGWKRKERGCNQRSYVSQLSQRWRTVQEGCMHLCHLLTIAGVL